MIPHRLRQWHIPATTIGTADTAARLGGDEFVVLVADGDEASGLAQQIVASLATPLPLQGNRVALGVSVGIAIDSAATTPDKLLRDADLAMCAAKEASKGRYAEFHPSLHAKATERLELTALLDTAIQTGSLSLFHQPVITAASRLPVGSEALARWKRPGLGFVSPVRFIPLAEESGLIRSLTRWAIETGLAHAPTWLQQGLQLAVAVNAAAPAGARDWRIYRRLRRWLLITRLPQTPGHVLAAAGVSALAPLPPGFGRAMQRLADVAERDWIALVWLNFTFRIRQCSRGTSSPQARPLSAQHFAGIGVAGERYTVSRVIIWRSSTHHGDGLRATRSSRWLELAFCMKTIAWSSLLANFVR